MISQILIEEKKGEKQVVVKPNSKMIFNVLKLFQENNYLGEIKKIDDGKTGMLEVSLLGRINNVGVIKPRYSLKAGDFKKFEKRYLPASGFGFLVVSTNQGLMTNEEAIKKNIGGKLIAFIY